MTAAPIEGWVAPGFEAVRLAFAANFDAQSSFRDLGAALAVYRHGRCVVDLWGGWQDQSRTRPWARDTLVNVWSTTKGWLAAAVAQLVDRGQLAYEAPVASVWPEFAARGKGAIIVEQLLSHQAGLNGFDEPMSYETCLDWAETCARLANQAPLWAPGTETSYHALTFGWLAGEIIRRASGAASVGAYVRENLAGPLGADVFIGLPSSLHDRVADLIPPPPAPQPASPPDAIAGRAFVNPAIGAEVANTKAWREAQAPAGNGQASAQGVARIYAALANGGALEGVRIISPQGVERMIKVRSDRPDRALGPRRWAAGIALNTGLYGPNADTFGHSGWGGSFGCADRESGIAIGYVMNRMAGSLNDDPRARRLVEAVFNSAQAGKG